MSRLQVRDVHKRFGAVTALAGVTLDVAEGECVALVGESGSGKTTLLRLFNRTVAPDRGRVSVEGNDVASTDPVELRRRTGYVQQEGGLLPHWTVARNVALVPWLLGRSDASVAAEHALHQVGLDPARFGGRWPRQLSGGQRQRVAIARALAAEPRTVLLDEPFGALDAITRSELQSMLRRLIRDGTEAPEGRPPLTVLLVTHDLREALSLADRVVVLREGRIEQVAESSTLLEAPQPPYVEELLRRAGLRSARP